MRFNIPFLLALAVPVIASDWVIWSYNNYSGDWCAGEARYTVGDYPMESHCYPIEEGFDMAIAGEFDDTVHLTAYTEDYCAGEAFEDLAPRKCFAPGNGVQIRSYSISR